MEPTDDTSTETPTGGFSWKRVGVVLVVLAVIGLAIGGVIALTGGGDKPISEQSCSELVATLHRIQDDEAPGADVDTQSQAAKDAVELNTRVDNLGGCPDEPGLQ